MIGRKRRASKNKSPIWLDAMFCAHGEMIPDNGEDSYYHAVHGENGILAVFDGCGGLGARKYQNYNAKTGAYVASKAAAKVFEEWFEMASKKEFSLTGNMQGEVSRELMQRLQDAFQALQRESGGVSVIKGDMHKEFPTTASAILYKREKKALQTMFLWAGDSRGYCLNASGLTQITHDDLCTEEDAFDNLRNDAVLENVIAASGEFRLNTLIFSINVPTVLVTATDGCFAYFSTPMEFEYLLIDTLTSAKSQIEWEEALTNRIKEIAGDDFTLEITAIGYGSFEKLKKAFAKRKTFLYKQYISDLKNADETVLKDLWEEYKKSYYRGAV